MKISTRGRYALRVIVDMAEHGNGEYIPLKDVAGRQNISQKYLESIATDLSKADILDGLHGKGGGYKLKRDPDDLTVGDILRVTEGDLAPVTCLESSSAPCSFAVECRTLAMWKEFYSLINGFFDGITVSSLMRKKDGGNDYVI